MSDRLTLSDVLGRGISMEWHEGVALVRGVAERLLDASREATVVPELHHVEISAAGHVNVTGGIIANEPVRRLGQLLQATLGHTEAPVQLRLFIVQATAPAPAFASIREYDAALAYFERPGRETVLQALCARAAAASPISGAEPTLDAVAPLPASDQPKPARRPGKTRSKPRALKLAAAAVIFLSLCAAGAWYAGSAAGKRDVSEVALQASNAVSDALLSGLSAVTERSGLGRLVPAEEGTVETPAAPDHPAAKQPRLRRRPSSPEPLGAPIVVFDLDSPPSAGTQASTAADGTSALSRDVATEWSALDGELIFSSESEDVSPPVGVRPQLPRELPANLTTDQLSRVELIVSEAGIVDSVKLFGTPHSVHDFMFLSAAKAWQFHPALKDGVPVRYRKTVWIASQ
jgi:hypothetical protein